MPLQRYVVTPKLFLIPCQNCATFSTVKSVVSVRLHVDESCASRVIAFGCSCGERAVRGEHSAARTRPFCALIPQSPSSADSKYCRICGSGCSVFFRLPVEVIAVQEL